MTDTALAPPRSLDVTDDDYVTAPGRRWMKHLSEWLDVTEIRLPGTGGLLVGFILSGEDDHVYGVAELFDGATSEIEHCALDTEENRAALILDVISVWGEHYLTLPD